MLPEHVPKKITSTICLFNRSRKLQLNLCLRYEYVAGVLFLDILQKQNEFLWPSNICTSIFDFFVLHILSQKSSTELLVLFWILAYSLLTSDPVRSFRDLNQNRWCWWAFKDILWSKMYSYSHLISNVTVFSNKLWFHSMSQKSSQFHPNILISFIIIRDHYD